MKKKQVEAIKEYGRKIEIGKRLTGLTYIVVGVISILAINLFYIQITKQETYQKKIQELTKKTVLGNSAPRGRIYDRNHKLIVDNRPIKVLYYQKEKGITTKKELELAYQMSEIISFESPNITKRTLQDFWVRKYPEEAKKKITEAEWQAVEERKLTMREIDQFKLERITEAELNSFSDADRKAAYLYYLMNQGYSYDEKIIKKENVTDLEYAMIAEQEGEKTGFYTKLDWEREYLYGSVFRTILGTVSSNDTGIPKELKEEYLKNGYQLNDRVGTSYLEYQYESILKGTKDEYELLADGNRRLMKAGKRGNDIVLSIDIELQKSVEEILMRQLERAKKEPNTEYYNRSFVVVTDPNTGEVLAMAGKQIIRKQNGYELYDYTPGITTSPVVVGSVVKGASHIVGYNTGALKIGEVRDDACMKIASTPLKCSWRYLGTLNDITALKLSSNTYQYRTAIKVGKGSYLYDGPLILDLAAYQTYRDTFAQFGLGVETGIDLPVESVGVKGKSTDPGLLLAFAIGQYDTYTPIQLAQYIGTIATKGKRMQPYLLKEVYEPTKEALTTQIKKTEPVLLNEVTTKPEYFERVHMGFRQVLSPGGTGYYTIDPIYQPAGKTGTSQSFIDTNNDKLVDKETITATFVGYAPYDHPTVTFTIVSPDVSHYDNQSSYQTNVNARIAQEVSKKFFEIYK